MARGLSRLKFGKGAAQRNALRRGSFAPEFALLAPIIFLMLMGTVEFCLIFGGQQLLENAAFNASRLGKTGYVETNMTQSQTVTQVLYNELQSYGNFFDTSKVAMTSSVYSTFESSQSGSGTSGFGTAQEIVVYEVRYPWKIFTPIMCTALGSVCYKTSEGAFIDLTTSIVVRNEPYAG